MNAEAIDRSQQSALPGIPKNDGECAAQFFDERLAEALVQSRNKTRRTGILLGNHSKQIVCIVQIAVAGDKYVGILINLLGTEAAAHSDTRRTGAPRLDAFGGQGQAVGYRRERTRDRLAALGLFMPYATNSTHADL